MIGFSLHKDVREAAIVMELMTRGNLETVLTNPDENWTPTRMSMAIFGIAAGMALAHTFSLIHRDLRPTNIFVDQDCHIKIGEFGLARLHTPNDAMKTLFVASDPYTAPELYGNEGGEQYGLPADVWSYGMTVYHFFENTWKFGTACKVMGSTLEMIRHIQQGDRPFRPPGMPDYHWELIERCWHIGPDSRPTFDDILSEFVQSNFAYAFPGTDCDALADYQRRVLDALDANRCVQYPGTVKGPVIREN